MFVVAPTNFMNCEEENGHDLEDWLQAESEVVPAGLKLSLIAEGVKRVAA